MGFRFDAPQCKETAHPLTPNYTQLHRKIMGFRFDAAGGREYLVHWWYFSHAWDTFEPVSRAPQLPLLRGQAFADMACEQLASSMCCRLCCCSHTGIHQPPSAPPLPDQALTIPQCAHAPRPRRRPTWGRTPLPMSGRCRCPASCSAWSCDGRTGGLVTPQLPLLKEQRLSMRLGARAGCRLRLRSRSYG